MMRELHRPSAIGDAQAHEAANAAERSKIFMIRVQPFPGMSLEHNPKASK